MGGGGVGKYPLAADRPMLNNVTFTFSGKSTSNNPLSEKGTFSR